MEVNNMGYSKLLIKGEIEVVTGLHIGGSSSYSAIGAVDSPVVRDSVTGNPIIPGSSLKGKMRALLQKNLWCQCFI
jgi:CRISPR-associated protein Csm3